MSIRGENNGAIDKGDSDCVVLVACRWPKTTLDGQEVSGNLRKSALAQIRKCESNTNDSVILFG